MKTRFLAPAAVCACLLATPTAPVHAAGSAAPGRSVGHVFLGMDRADVWKILGKPGQSWTVAHGGSLYANDGWGHADRFLQVLSERDKVIQVEWNSPRITTTDGLSTATGLSRVRRLHPAMAVRLYGLITDDNNGCEDFYLDDIKAGIAFTICTQEGLGSETLNVPPSTLIVHRPGRRALPTNGGRWSALEPPQEDPDSLRLLRSWFTPHGPRRGK